MHISAKIRKIKQKLSKNKPIKHLFAKKGQNVSNYESVD